MAQRRLTINLPGSPEALHDVLKMLLQYGLITEKKARNIEHEEVSKKKGVLYDSEVVEACMNLIKKKNFDFS